MYPRSYTGVTAAPKWAAAAGSGPAKARSTAAPAVTVAAAHHPHALPIHMYEWYDARWPTETVTRGARRALEPRRGTT